MRLNELVALWSSRRDAFRIGVAQVDGAAVCAEIVRDLQQLDIAAEDELLPLAEAAKRSGYSVTHLRRQIHAGILPSQGKGKDRVVRHRDLPRRAGTVAPESAKLQLLGAKAEQVVRASAGVSRESP